MQAMAHGEIGSLKEIRQVVKESFPPIRYEPQESELWEEAYIRFIHLLDHRKEARER